MNATEYVAKFPRYCRTCNGIGGHKGRDLGMPKDCPDCFGRGVCGRCAADMPKYSATCPTCGWHVFNAADALPGETTSNAPVEGITLDDVKTAILEAQKRTRAEIVQKVLMAHGGRAALPNGREGPSLRALPPEKYAAVIEALRVLPSTR